MTPTQLTLRELRKTWPIVEVVEHRVPHTFTTRDLFGCVDVLAIGPDGVLAVQCTGDNGGNVASRVRKIAEAEALPWMREAGWQIEVWGWKQASKGARYTLRKVDVS